MKKHPLRKVWVSMIHRCTNPSAPNYSYYGGRGVSVCAQWLDSFDQWLVDVGDRPSAQHQLDRIESNKPYEPGNVKWSTRRQNIRNRRCTKMVCVDGVRLPLGEYCEAHGLYYPTINSRLLNGWSVERALKTPVATKPSTHPFSRNHHSRKSKIYSYEK